jgi:glycosyltransferase involved in cell wall biosynthesis
LSPGERPIEQNNPFRTGNPDKFIVGLSGNLGFTHDPETVFKAAQILSGNLSIHFLLSGSGVGWGELVSAQEAVRLPNVTLIESVAANDLETFLAAADLWIIPYRRNMAGVSVPSRLYNLLAIGRPIVALSEPDAEHSVMLREHDIGWVVEPENATALAETILAASRNPDDLAVKRQNAARKLSDHFSRELTGAAYRTLVEKLRAQTPDPSPQGWVKNLE